MAVQVTNYQCPACTGPLQYDGASGQLACEYCGSSFPVAEIEALYADKDALAAANLEQAEKEERPGGEEWDTSGMTDSWGTDAEGLKVYLCPSCGAELVCDETTAATFCPYCGNPSIVPGQLAGALKPDLVIPFKLKKEDAIQSLKKHYEGKPLLPDAFKDKNHLEEIQGVYVPFWLFSGDAEGDASYSTTRTHSYKAGDYRVTETSHFAVFRQGNISFERIPVDASSQMPDDYMESLEPYNYADLTDFSTAYLPGYMAHKYDISADDSRSRADARAETTVAQCLRETVSGYATILERNKHIRLYRGEVKYALLPVWLLTTKWQDQTYLFAMNGQTGKFVGNLPVDKRKRWKLFGKAYAITAGVLLALSAILGLL
ncbi:MAG: hypothetical protein IJF79_04475 [Clostridia bacterium]|nr:hypothetical protein [Clostridia bacterium]